MSLQVSSAGPIASQSFKHPPSLSLWWSMRAMNCRRHHLGFCAFRSRRRRCTSNATDQANAAAACSFAAWEISRYRCRVDKDWCPDSVLSVAKGTPASLALLSALRLNE